ncbi:MULTISPECIES: transglutaminase domain-containing protein [unclassified Microbacterium]|uniref:transglutaminase family protein n=1 Tax=unclassified Microbacterium TaxID=2609290 RepID=UPI000EA89EE1|nr:MULTISPECIES: transglutaminase domain-containing protein [unclassified Microbacterium]MBT2484526.1 transglutaminase domain-containing protein [Microbacterium sp. ISL-108]RKN67427.1 transglutaminase domain-containing protein [Microbacterium sp. CGR2]
MTAPAAPARSSSERSETKRPAASEISVRRWVLDLGATALLVIVAMIGFWPTFAGPSFLPAAIGGVVLGLAISAAAAWRRWGILVITGLTIAAYFVFGAALALPQTAILGVIPSLETLQKLAVGPVTAWKQMLTTVAPVAASDGHLLVPYLLALVATVLTASLALRLSHVAWALLPAGVLLMLVIALGTPEPAFPVVQGLVFAVVSIAWLALRQLWAPQNAAVSVGEVDPSRASHMRTRRLLAGVAVLAVAGAAGVATSAIAAPAQPRHVFRDVIIPPFDIRDYPSPLQAFRKNVRDAVDDTLFTVQGLPKGARVRTAVMDQFDGMVYNVTDGGPTSSSAFSPLRSNMSPEAEGVPVTLKIAIEDYNGVWMPTAGQLSEIRFRGDREEELRRGTYVNTMTGTAVATPKLAKGDEYTVDAVMPAELDDKQLAEVPFGTVAMPKPSNVPEELTTLAAETVASAETPIEQVRALESFLAEGGFFSHGLEGEVLSRAGHTAERVSTLVGGDQMIGDDEQYSVTMALLAGELGIPARVVMGYYPDEEQEGEATFTATGDNVHAWVEVNFEGVGWLTFNPTPPEDQVPNDQNTKPRVDPKPQVLQPPPPPQEPVDLPPTLPDDRESEDENLNLAGLIGAILLIGGISLAVIAILASPFIVIGAWKASKRRARRAAERTADRISGGWDELTDRAVDYGARLPAGGTRTEEASTLVETLAVPQVAGLAVRADADVFGPSEPTPQDVEAFWTEVDSIVGDLGKDAGFWKRTKARLSLRSLLGGSALSSGLQGLKDAAAARVRREPGTIDRSSTSSPVAPESETS